MILKSKIHEKKNDILNFKIKTVLQDSFKTMKDSHQAWIKHMQTTLSDKGLVSRIYLEFLKFNRKKENNVIRKRG